MAELFGHVGEAPKAEFSPSVLRGVRSVRHTLFKVAYRHDKLGPEEGVREVGGIGQNPLESTPMFSIGGGVIHPPDLGHHMTKGRCRSIVRTR